MTRTHQADPAYHLFGETEHQELWYPGADLRRPLSVHIPSALGTLGYFVCVRIPQVQADRLDAIEVRADIGGLRPDHLCLKAGDGFDGPSLFPSAEPGQVWRILCRAAMSRGDGTLVFEGWPRAIRSADVLLCTWPRYLSSGMADDYLRCRQDPLWTPTGIPLGGIGTGKVELCRDGRFRNYTGNNNQDMPLEEPGGLPHAWLAVGRGPTLRTLTSRPVDGLATVPRLGFRGRFPQALLSALNAWPDLDVRVTATGPWQPHNLRRSCLPAVLLRWKLTYRGRGQGRFRCVFRWPNFIGIGGGIARAEGRIGYGDGFYQYWEETAGRAARPWSDRDLTGVLFRGPRRPRHASSAGEILMAVRHASDGSARCGAAEAWGDIAREVNLASGESTTVDMVLVWAMPHWIDTLGVDRGHLWQAYAADAAAIAREMISQADDIVTETGALTKLLARTDLPSWLQNRLLNCNYPLVTNSVLYRDGRFSINEGPTEMAGCYGTMDQRLGAHPTTQFFFPALNRQELSQFAAVQSPNGGINHDLGGGHLESPARDQPWPDLPCSFILQCARHAWTTGDAAFERAMWPRARRALVRAARWAEQGGGIAQVGHASGLGTSYDGYHYEGTTPYLGTLWLAALAVMDRWALARHDAPLSQRIRCWRRDALACLDRDVWNGRFFDAYGSPGGPRRRTSHAGQLAGQHFARLLAGVDVLPAARLNACVKALMQLNGHRRFRVPPDEVTRGGRAAVEFGWLPYVEAFGLTAAASAGHPRVMEVWRRVLAAYEDRGRRPCDTRLMYRPLSGEPSWGSFYMTAPASWLVYEALLDFAYRPMEGVLRLNPSLEGRVAVVHPLWWGVAWREQGRLALRIDRVFTTDPIAVKAIEVRHGNGYTPRRLPAPVSIKPGALIQWRV